MMKNLEKLVEMTDAEFGAIAQNGKYKSREEIHSVYELMDIAKDAYEIWCMEEEMEGGEDGMSSAGGSYYRDGRGGGGRGGSNRGGSYYEDGGYERRGRGRNARRDSMGRYARGEGGSYREGSYRDGGMMRRGGSYRDGGKEEFAENLRELMEDAPDSQTRQQIQQMISQMEQQ